MRWDSTVRAVISKRRARNELARKLETIASSGCQDRSAAVNGTSRLWKQDGCNANVGRYFGTGVEEREVHWPKGQAMAELFHQSSLAQSSLAGGFVR
jgi:hypothetical protein